MRTVTPYLIAWRFSLHPASPDCIAVLFREDKIFPTGPGLFRPDNPHGPALRRYHQNRFRHQSHFLHHHRYRHRQRLQQMR
ncbi:hypothetical protein ABKU80_23270 [Enterobacter mori]|uniref:hypothetical protein n=1 Tax=Enterobacter mori TaxID=539813 RepID=UPI0026E232C0|nr:hypothetical protein [Enterobacter mori]WKW38960.1 hypothetical protein PZO51_05690 [Enterobacter mori]